MICLALIDLTPRTAGLRPAGAAMARRMSGDGRSALRRGCVELFSRDSFGKEA